MINIEDNKNLYIAFLRQTQRQGVEDLISWLETTDFFTAPAATKYHNCVDGGLCDHSLRVLDCAVKISNALKISIPTDSLILICLLHDLCKIKFYYKAQEAKMKKDGTIEMVEMWKIRDHFPAGHGEKSVFLALFHDIKLSEKEMLSINYHMGSFDARSGEIAFRDGFNSSYAPLLHAADMLSSQYLEDWGN